MTPAKIHCRMAGRRRHLSDCSVILDWSLAISDFSGDAEANAKSIGLAYV
jgi:hypothetical protein